MLVTPRERYDNHERRRVYGGRLDQGKEECERGKTRGLLREGEGVHQKRALRYARAIGTIVILIGGHWLATVITLRCHRHSIVACPLVSSPFVADASKHAAME
jgi:hypothetical protein